MSNNSELKYSVLMSIYFKENPDFFRLAIDSMIHQTITPDEIVLVEDGPLTSELYDVIEEYVVKYPNLIQIISFEKNLGLGLALNKGLEKCRNELVARMDTDDISRPDRCELQLLFFMKNPECSILGGQIEEFILSPDEVVGKRLVPETDAELKCYIKKRCPFNHMTVMFKKTAVLEAGNYQDWFWNEDYFLWIRMALNNYFFANLPETLVKVRVGKEMYSRRGGEKYFKSEVAIQRLMLEKGMINRLTFFDNCLKRFILQKMLPNTIRTWVFRYFARS